MSFLLLGPHFPSEFLAARPPLGSDLPCGGHSCLKTTLSDRGPCPGVGHPLVSWGRDSSEKGEHPWCPVTCVLLRAVAWGPCAVLSGVHAVVTEVLDSSVCDIGDWAIHRQETPIPGCVSGPWGGALLCDH